MVRALMLNRHVLVLFLGLPAALLLRGAPVSTSGPLGAAFVVLVAGLFLDSGRASPRTTTAHLFQAVGIVLLLIAAVPVIASHAGLLLAGIALAAGGVLAEMRLPLARLRLAVATQLTGDLIYLAGLLAALFARTETPSRIGWVFIALSGVVALYAVVTNALLQLSRLRDPQAGWRYRVTRVDAQALTLRSPDGPVSVPRSVMQRVEALDPRHLFVVLPSPLPDTLGGDALPLQELRREATLTSAEPPPPDAYALVLHEQELGVPVATARQLLG